MRMTLMVLFGLASLASGCARAGSADEDLSEYTTAPEEWAGFAAGSPSCSLPPVPESTSWREWPLPDGAGIVRFPDAFVVKEIADASEYEALFGISAVAVSDTVALLFYSEPGGGLAIGPGVQVDHVEQCSVPVMGRAALAARFRTIVPAVGDTAYHATLDAALRRGLALSAQIVSRDERSRDQMLRIVSMISPARD